MNAEGWLALAAVAGAYGHIAWDIYATRRTHRSDVRVTARHELVAVASGSYVVTVVVTNHGLVTERIERVGLWLRDATGLFEQGSGLEDLGVWKEVDEDLPARANYRWSYDFGSMRFRHGLGYEPWAQLATGEVVTGQAGVADPRGMEIAGLGSLLTPLSLTRQIDGAKRSDS